MKYMLLMEFKDPFADNMRKVSASQKERIEKGLSFTREESLFPWHFSVTEGKAVAIYETDDEMKVVKWVLDYSPYAKVQAIPLVGLAEYTKKMAPAP